MENREKINWKATQYYYDLRQRHDLSTVHDVISGKDGFTFKLLNRLSWNWGTRRVRRTWLG
jgi:hypothetical protein